MKYWFPVQVQSALDTTINSTIYQHTPHKINGAYVVIEDFKMVNLIKMLYPYYAEQKSYNPPRSDFYFFRW